MEYDDNTKSNHLKNYGEWFQSKGFSQYKVPKTVLQNEYILPASSKEKKSKDNQSFAKGFHFQKAKKPKLFLTTKSPGPALYDLSNSNSFKPLEIKQKKSASKSKSKRLKSNSKEKVKLPGVGAYNVDYSQHNKKYKETKFGRAEKVSYFQQAMLNGTLTPAPGQCYQKINRSQSVVLIPKSLNLQQTKQTRQPKVKKTSTIGPGSYQIKRSSSVTCFAILNNPYKQKDENMKSRIIELRKSKQNMQTPDPGKYIKIEQWGKFNGSRQISNGLKNLSKPELKIYN